jgi:hypothetical protein
MHAHWKVGAMHGDQKLRSPIELHVAMTYGTVFNVCQLSANHRQMVYVEGCLQPLVGRETARSIKARDILFRPDGSRVAS